MDKQRKEGKVHEPTPWYDQYNKHAHNHITLAVAAKDSCFALRRAHQYDIASTLSIAITDPSLSFTAEADAQAPQLHTTHVVVVGC